MAGRGPFIKWKLLTINIIASYLVTILTNIEEKTAIKL